MSNSGKSTFPPSAAEAIALIQSSLGSLVASERRVAEVVLANPRDVIRLTASKLGALADTSATTVIRFARNSGFAGYQELAIALAISESETRLDSLPQLSTSDTPGESLQNVASVAAFAVLAAATAVDPAQFEAAVRAVAQAPHTLTIGASLTAPVAQDLAFRLNHLGIAADAPSDSQIQRIRAESLRPGDVCVLFLLGGKYPPVVDVALAAKQAGATVIAVTAFVRTPLAELADISLIVGASALSTGLDAWACRLAFLAVVDALLVSISNTDPAKYGLSRDRIIDLLEQDLL